MEVLILSDNLSFARFLELETQEMGFSPLCFSNWNGEGEYPIVLWDMDTVSLDEGIGKNAFIFGFTAENKSENISRCNLVFHRPFLVSLFHEEMENAKHFRPSYSYQNGIITLGEKECKLSKTEQKIFTALQEEKIVSILKLQSLFADTKDKENSLRVHLSYLRTKLNTFFEKDVLQNEKGKGYSLNIK